MSKTLRGAVRIFVVAEVRLYREGLVKALHRETGLTVVGAAADAASLDQRTMKSAADVIVFDTAVAGAMRVFRELTANGARARIVALGIREDENDIAACAAAGVSGFVAREASFEELVRAIVAVSRGESACSATILTKLLRRIATLAPLDPAADLPLTVREREIFALVEQGMSNKEIAERLSVELSTVKNHVHNVLDKLQVHRRGEAVARVRHQRVAPIQVG